MPSFSKSSAIPTGEQVEASEGSPVGRLSPAPSSWCGRGPSWLRRPVVSPRASAALREYQRL